MILLGQILGLAAVATFLLSYQQKKRKQILVCNVVARILYIVQYILLSAFEGAVLDIVGTVSLLLAGKKENAFIKKHQTAIFIGINLIIIGAGLALYEDIYSLFAIAGVLLQTGALWLNNEKVIRIVSLIGAPCWFIYNFANMAYGSAIGDLLTAVSIIIAIYRHDIRKSDLDK